MYGQPSSKVPAPYFDDKRARAAYDAKLKKLSEKCIKWGDKRAEILDQMEDVRQVVGDDKAYSKYRFAMRELWHKLKLVDEELAQVEVELGELEREFKETMAAKQKVADQVTMIMEAGKWEVIGHMDPEDAEWEFV